MRRILTNKDGSKDIPGRGQMREQGHKGGTKPAGQCECLTAA